VGRKNGSGVEGHASKRGCEVLRVHADRPSPNGEPTVNRAETEPPRKLPGAGIKPGLPFFLPTGHPAGTYPVIPHTHRLASEVGGHRGEHDRRTLMTHTKGPWSVTERPSGSENHKGWNLWGAREDDGHGGHSTWVGEISPVINNERGDYSEEGIANARLIVAAPELLELFRAIAKMQGERDEDGVIAPAEPYSWETVARCALDYARAAIAKAEGK